jgi:hypothetical protein
VIVVPGDQGVNVTDHILKVVCYVVIGEYIRNFTDVNDFF